MKFLALFVVVYATAFYSIAAERTGYKDFCPKFSTNIEVIWQATNQWPENLWTYKVPPTRPTQREIISNAFVLASLPVKDIPQPSTNTSCWLADDCPDCQCFRGCNFCGSPANQSIYFSEPHKNDLTNNIPNDEQILKLGYEIASRFGLDKTNLILKEIYVSTNKANQVCGRGVRFSRGLEGVSFFGNGMESDMQGFIIEFGGNWQVRFFYYSWLDILPNQNERTLTTNDIALVIRAHKAMLFPNPDEERFFDRIKGLAAAKKLTITKITPYYCNGILGNAPTETPTDVAPFIQIDAKADFGSSNSVLTMMAPITVSNFRQLTAK